MRVEQTSERVANVAPALTTRLRWRAERRARRLDAVRVSQGIPFFRWEVARERVRVGDCAYDDRWVVVAMQNRAAP